MGPDEFRRALLERRAALKRRIAAIDALLEEDDHGMRSDDPQPNDAGSAPAETGIREAILKVLERAPRGLKPIQITQELQRKGFMSSGKTELKLKVGNETWRLARAKKLERTGGGRYRIAKHN